MMSQGFFFQVNLYTLAADSTWRSTVAVSWRYSPSWAQPTCTRSSTAWRRRSRVRVWEGLAPPPRVPANTSSRSPHTRCASSCSSTSETSGRMRWENMEMLLSQDVEGYRFLSGYLLRIRKKFFHNILTLIHKVWFRCATLLTNVSMQTWDCNVTLFVVKTA